MRGIHRVDATVLSEFTAHGLDCRVVRFEDHLCGYVRAEGVAWRDLERVEIAGELTYGVDEDGWVGFDGSDDPELGPARARVRTVLLAGAVAALPRRQAAVA